MKSPACPLADGEGTPRPRPCAGGARMTQVDVPAVAVEVRVVDEDKPEKVRFGRAQKFRLSPRGDEAARAYAEMIEKARSGNGRAQFEAARNSWGASLGLVAEDGLFLADFAAGPRTIAEAARSLDSCGTTAKEVKTAVDRLLGLGMLEPVPAPPEPAPAHGHYRRW